MKDLCDIVAAKGADVLNDFEAIPFVGPEDGADAALLARIDGEFDAAGGGAEDANGGEPPADAFDGEPARTEISITARPARTHFLNDVGYSDAFSARYRDRLRFIPEEGAWLIFDPSTGWRRDTTGAAMATGKEFARELLRDACERARGLDAKAAAQAVSNAARLGDRARITSALELAKVQPGMVQPLATLDAEPLLLGARNGYLNLADGTFHKHDPGVLVTRHVEADYDPTATAPVFDRFLAEVQPDREMRDYLQRLFGYALTGLMGEHTIGFHFGSGANGKSTLLEGVFLRMLGGYGQKITESLTYVDKRGAVPHLEIAQLAGARFALGEESSEGGRLNEPLLKKLSGGDKAKGRFHYGNFFEFSPVAKIHLVGNHKPTVSGRDEGIWRRLRLIDWRVSIPEAQRDHRLWQKLEPEFSGFLNWAAAGAFACVGAGSTRPPDSVLASTAQFKEDSDAFGDFLRECTIEEPAATCTKARFFETYLAYCDAGGIGERFRYTKRRIAFLMAERGFQDGKLPSGARAWLGIRPKNENELGFGA